MRQKGIVGIFVLLILALAIAGGAYYFGKTSNKPQVAELQRTEQAIPDPTADWKTYSHQSNVFEIKHPRDVEIWPTRITPESVDFYKKGVADPAKGGQGQGDPDIPCCGFGIYLRDPGFAQYEFTEIPTEKITIAGYSVIRSTTSPEFQEEIWIPNPNGQVTARIFFTTTNEKPELRKQNFETYKKMLETFRFLQ